MNPQQVTIMNKYIKPLALGLAGIGLGILGYTSVHSLKEWQTDTVLVQGLQICKRVESTKFGDRFYLILDSQYGVAEVPVSYTKYIASSNDEVRGVYYSPRALSIQLEDTQELQEDYPMLKHLGLYLLLWIASVVGAIILFACSVPALSCHDNPYPAVGLGLMLLGAILNIWL